MGIFFIGLLIVTAFFLWFFYAIVKWKGVWKKVVYIPFVIWFLFLADLLVNLKSRNFWPLDIIIWSTFCLFIFLVIGIIKLFKTKKSLDIEDSKE